jgi:DnaJ-class molecular chaperone
MATIETVEVCNIWLPRCSLTLSPSEILCPNCNGQGAKMTDAHFKSRSFTITKCILCGGEGKIDWITQVTKKPRSQKLFVTEIKNIKMHCVGGLKCKSKLKRMWKDRERKEFGQDWMTVW